MTKEEYMSGAKIPTTEPTITVFLDEEYGYREWRWETGMTAEQLETFWSQIDDMWAICSNLPESLPGKLVPLCYDELPEGWKATDHWTAGIHEDDDSALATPGPDRRVILHRGAEATVAIG
jgi:hypothetical protein